MSDPAVGPSAADRDLVERQLGRRPRGEWRVGTRCVFGRPNVVVTAPVLRDGTPFPTLFWLACPWLTVQVADRESAGGAGSWSARAAAEPDLAASLSGVEARYRAARAAEAGGQDPFPATGIAGQRDPLGVKCLHARVAAALAGLEDPVGLATLRDTGASCPDDHCASLVSDMLASPARCPALVESPT